MRNRRWLAAFSIGSLLGLITVGLAWELWLSPLRPGGSWLVLKVIPLLLPLRGMLHARRYTFQWVSLLALLYVLEGSGRLFLEHGTGAILAAGELFLALVLFATAIGCVRAKAD